MLTMTVLPEPIYAVRRQYDHLLHFDIVLTNHGDDELELQAIWLHILGPDRSLIARRFIDTNGLVPSIATLPERRIRARGELFVFNPFPTFAPDLPLAQLELGISVSPLGSEQTTELTSLLQPRVYTTKTDLCLPLAQRVLVYDGHDFYSHHRRIDLSAPIARRLGLRANAGRYAYDFVPVDERGQMWRSDGSRREDWLGFEAEVRAPGDGTVRYVQSAIIDNQLDGRAVIQALPLSLDDAASFAGNCVILDHHNGEYSLLAHLRENSVGVTVGEDVRRGQMIGQIGFSGSTGNWVHLHYELRSTAHPVHAEGLPSAFFQYRRVLGQRLVPVARGSIDTGDIVESIV
jgi:hypothetical protein